MTREGDAQAHAQASGLAIEATLPAVGATGAALQPGARLDRYEIIKLLGEGGMGTVFLARDLRLGRRVAIKLLQVGGAEQAGQLLAEARTTARFQHDNIVVVHEVGEHAGVPYLVLEYLDGKPLTALIANGQRVPVARAVEIVCGVARALQHAHEAGVVHRDLKPANVVVTAAGAVKVLDFGIAKVLRAAEPVAGAAGAAAELAGEGGADGAIASAAAGTPLYMAPEQWAPGGEIDHRTDLWACGILLHQLICGRHPLQVSQLITTAVLGRPMPSLAEAAPPEVPRELIGIVDRCLRKRKEERWGSAAELLGALSALAPERRVVALGAGESPYAGLASFQEGDAGKFFGRTREIAELVARLRDRPLIAVVGSSGVGKSSFVRAGVIPALKRSGEAWEAVVVRPGRRPIEALAWVIRPMLATAENLVDEVEEQRRLGETLRRAPGHLGHVLRLHARREDRRLLVFVDQLEELYTQVTDAAERAAFTACLAAVADDATSPLRVVLSIRADFFDRIGEDRRFAGELAQGLFFLGTPGRDGLRNAIASPAELAGYRFEDASIVEEMLDGLAATPGALPLLQFAAAKLWELRDAEHRLLTRASYDAIGGVAGALASHADRVLEHLGPGRVALARTLLLRLVSAERTRAIVPLAELRALSAEEGAVQGLIDRLVDARLLVVQTPEDDNGATVEIVHESLVEGWPALRRWLDEHQEDAAFVDQLRTAARQWEAKGRDRGLLWRGDALAEYERWRRRNAASLLPLEAAFGAASAADTARGRRIRRVVAAVAIAVTAVFFVALWRASVAADDARHDAEALLRDSYLEQGRLRGLEGDRLGALAPLAAAYRMGARDAATRFMLEEAARPTRARLLTLEGHTDKIWEVAYSPDGRWLATASTDRTARLWDAETGALRATVQHAEQVGWLAFSPDSRFLASSGMAPTVRVLDAIAGREILALPAAAGARHLSFSPDSSRLLAATSSGAVMLWRIPSGEPAGELGGHGRNLGGVFCGDGSCIVTWDEDRVVVWDPVTLAQRASYPQRGTIYAVAVSRAGSLIAVGTGAGELVLLRADGRELARRAAHEAMIFDLTVSHDGTTVATGSSEPTVRLWSASGEPRGILAGHRANIMAVRFTPAGDRVVTASADQTARLWSASGMLLGELTGHTDIVMALAVRPDGRRLATASWDHTVIVWDLARAQELRPIFTARDDAAPKVAFDPRGDRLAIARADGSLSIIDVRTGAATCTAPGESAAAAERIVWHGADEVAVIRAGEPAIELRDARRCAVAATLAHPAPPTAVSARSGPRLVTAADGVVRVWRGGRIEATFSGYPGRISRVGADGDDVYAVTVSPVTVVVDALGAGARPRRIFLGGALDFDDVGFDRRRGRVFATSWDQSVHVWDAATAVRVHKLAGTGPLASARLSPDGAIGIGIGGISPAVWDAASGARLGKLAGHADLVKDGDFLDDQLFVSLAQDHTALVWDVRARRPLKAFRDVDALAFTEDRRAVALVSAFGVRIWSPRTPELDLDALRGAAPR